MRSPALPLGAGSAEPRPGIGMDSFWRLEPEKLVLWIAALAVLAAVGYYVFAKIRPKASQKEPKASEWLSKFREWHDEGGLSDQEFREIKTTLALQLRDELRDTDETV